MAYGESKVYFDGSHYIAIPHTTRPSRKRKQLPEEEITINEQEKQLVENVTNNDGSPSIIEDEPFGAGIDDENDIEAQEPIVDEKPKIKKVTRKELFEDAYRKSLDMRKSLRKNFIFNELRYYFKSDEKCMEYVTANIERKERNLISRRIRMTRKANLQEFNYFCTFTYDSKLHTEDSFKYKLRHCLSNLSRRKGWKYMGVWERSPEKKRLHFHGLFYIPDGTMPGKIIQVNDYSFGTHKRQITNQNLYFTERFGRNDFEPVEDQNRVNDAKAYLMKYLEKSGERIVYSKGMPQFFISDILEEDIVCRIGMEEQKFLLFDDFSCFDEGVYMGQVSPEVIAQMRKVN